MRSSAAGLVLVFAIGFPAVGFGGLSPEEEGLVSSIDEAIPEATALLERTVNVNSGTMNFEGVREVGRIFGAELEKLGFDVRWADGADWNRAGHLIAEREGTGQGPHLLLIGHLDTVFEPESPFQRFERISETEAAGPGITDMKGGNVVMLLALRALREAGGLDRFPVTVVLTGDEEKAGRPLSLSRKDLKEAAERAEVAIGFEDGDGDPVTAVISRRSSGGWTLRTRGTPAHSSQVFREDIGSGAIFEAARILAAFHDSLAGEPYLTFNPGLILGGTTVDYEAENNRGSAFGKSNVIAESAVVAGDLRALSMEQRDRAVRVMEGIATAHGPHSGAELTFREGYPPLAPGDGNRRLLALFDRASRDLGFGPVAPVDPAKAGAADVSFTEGLVEMAMDGVGLMGRGGHTVEETADLTTLPVQAKRVAVMLWRLGREE